jgi:ORF6N domain
MTQKNADFEGMSFFGQSVIIPEISGFNLVKTVKKPLDRFPVDFMFQLTNQEFNDLKFQFGTSRQWGGRCTPPYAFSEQGEAGRYEALAASLISCQLELFQVVFGYWIRYQKEY